MATDLQITLSLLREHREARDCAPLNAAKHRKLYRLGTKAPTLNRDGTVPMLLRSNGDDGDDGDRVVHDEKEFIKRCYHSADSGGYGRDGLLRPLNGFELMRDGKGFVVAGGAVTSILQGDNWDRYAHANSQDIDLFLVGLSKEEALAEIHRLASHLGALAAKGQEGENLQVYRTTYTITFVGRSRVPVQIILRLYDSISELLYDFDLGSSAAAFDGEHVWMTKLGLLAHEFRVNVVDLSSRRLSYERRIEKYIDRGFGLILPGMCPEAISLAAEMDGGGWLSLGEKKLLQLQINDAGRIQEVDLVPAGQPESMYGETPSYCDWSDADIAGRNCLALSGETVLAGALCGKASYTPFLDVTTIQPRFDGLDECITEILQHKTHFFDTAKVLGADTMLQILTAGKAQALNAKKIASEIERRLAPRAVLPFNLTSGGFPRATSSAPSWYGSNYLPNGSGLVFPAVLGELMKKHWPLPVIKLLCRFVCSDFCDGCPDDCRICGFHVQQQDATENCDRSDRRLTDQRGQEPCLTCGR